jgi:hypothetical protein
MNELFLKSIYDHDTPDDVYKYVHDTRKKAFE